MEIVITLIIIVDIKGGYSLFSGMLHFSAGLITGISSLASGIAIGCVGEIGNKTITKQPKFFTPFILILIFCEMIGLFGLIIGLLVNVSGNKK